MLNTKARRQTTKWKWALWILGCIILWVCSLLSIQRKTTKNHFIHCYILPFPHEKSIDLFSSWKMSHLSMTLREEIAYRIAIRLCAKRAKEKEKENQNTRLRKDSNSGIMVWDKQIHIFIAGNAIFLDVRLFLMIRKLGGICTRWGSYF